MCLDGTNNQVKGHGGTNVVRLYDMLDLSDAAAQVAYYAPGVGTFSAPGAWTPLARTISRYEGLAFGAGLRQELMNAYVYLMNNYADGDRIFVFGFSRGAYSARALTGLLHTVGLFRPGAENLVPYVVSVFTKTGDKDFNTLGEYASSFARVIQIAGERSDRVPVHFVGIWDTVKAAGTARRPVTWPYTRHLEGVSIVRHAQAIDEQRRPFAPYDVEPLPASPGGAVLAQDFQQVWFAGVHSDVGGYFGGTHQRLSDIPLKWMTQQAAQAGLVSVPQTYQKYMTQVSEQCATDPPHRNDAVWKLVGSRRRDVPPGALLHDSVRTRRLAHPNYGTHLPSQSTYVDPNWLNSR